MKKDETTKFMYDEEKALATAIIYTPRGKVFVGTAQCHPDDMDFANALTGQEIAYRRASIKFLKDVRDNELKPGLQALNAYLYSINKGKYFDKKNPMVKILYHNISQRQEELSMVNEMIETERQQLIDYIKSKDDLYTRLRRTRTGSDKNAQS